MTDTPNAIPQPNAITDAKGLTGTGYRFLQSLEKSGRSTIASLSSLTTSVQALITFIASGAQGSVLYKGASDWAWLAPGTAGQLLQTNGAAANPSWVTQTPSRVLLAIGSITTTSQVNISGTWNYSALELVVVRLSHNGGSARNAFISFSDNSGSSFLNVSGNTHVANGATIGSSGLSGTTVPLNPSTFNSGNGMSVVAMIKLANLTSQEKPISVNSAFSSQSAQAVGHLGSSNAINYIRFTLSADSYDDGYYELYGIN